MGPIRLDIPTRPMQEFSEPFLKPVDRVIVVWTGKGGQAFVDPDDIAAVAAATLADPGRSCGRRVRPTGPDASR